MRPTESCSASRNPAGARRTSRVSLELTLTHLQPTTLARIVPLALLVVLGACRNDELGDAWGTTDGTNSVPVIAGTPPTRVLIGDTYDFAPEATDADGDVLTFSIENRPGWATFSPTTGRLTGRPPDSAADRVFSDIRISVSDSKAVAELPAYDLEVEPGARTNAPPSISGSPDGTVTVGNSYGFTPQASDADGDALRFSIANRPSWATFDTSNGALTGTPADADVGTYSGIVISVSDGAASAELPPFTITVSAPAPVESGSASLSWTRPTTNEDGSALTDLRGYRVYYGTSASALSSMVEIPDADVTTAVIGDLAPATWYFGVKAYNTDGAESDFSNIASKRID